MLRNDRLFLDGESVIPFVWMLRYSSKAQDGVVEVQEKVKVVVEEGIWVMWKQDLCVYKMASVAD